MFLQHNIALSPSVSFSFTVFLQLFYREISNVAILPYIIVWTQGTILA